MGEKGFVPVFGQLFLLLISALVSALIATIFLTGGAQIVMYVATLAFSIVGAVWIFWLRDERIHEHESNNQYHERENLLAAAKLFESTKHLPPAAALQTAGRLMPGLDLESIHIEPEVIQKHEPDGWHLQKSIPGGLARPDQYRTLANEYFGGKGRGAGPKIPIRYWTETDKETGRPPVFGRPQLETILEEIRKARMGDKDANGETSLNADGEDWLKRYHSPSFDGFTRI